MVSVFGTCAFVRSRAASQWWAAQRGHNTSVFAFICCARLHRDIEGRCEAGTAICVCLKGLHVCSRPNICVPSSPACEEVLVVDVIFIAESKSYVEGMSGYRRGVS